MSLSIAQDKFYWRLWSQLRKAQPGADRKAIHAQIGVPESHTDWRNADLDKWKAHALAKSQPANLSAQVKQLKMPAIRKRVFIGHILDALQLPEEYAEALLQRMNLRGGVGGPMVTLDTASEETLGKVMVALKMECRREWRTKEELLWVIGELRRENDFDDTHVAEAVRAALCWQSLPPLAKIYYEPLLVVLAVLRRMAAGEPAVTLEHVCGVDTPF